MVDWIEAPTGVIGLVENELVTFFITSGGEGVERGIRMRGIFELGGGGGEELRW